MIALILAHIAEYSDLYSMMFGVGCAAGSWHIVRRRPGEPEDGDNLPPDDDKGG